MYVLDVFECIPLYNTILDMYVWVYKELNHNPSMREQEVVTASLGTTISDKKW